MKTVSIVIPIYNEEEILEPEVVKILKEMEDMMPEIDYEIFLVENGSVDKTGKIAKYLSNKYSNVETIGLAIPSYGNAVKEGILQCDGRNVAIFNIDFWDVDFLKSSIGHLLSKEKDIVLGSKAMCGSKDSRTYLRRFITRGFNMFLRIFFGFQGTDTHGVKVMNKKRMSGVISHCITNRELFDTEFILRAQTEGLKIKEVPIECEEKRKSTIGVFKRIPRTLVDLVKLFYYIRICK